MEGYYFGALFSVEQHSGDLKSVYLSFRHDNLDKVKDLLDGAVLAEYDESGVLLAIEVKRPCLAKDLQNIPGMDDITRNFVKNCLPACWMVQDA